MDVFGCPLEKSDAGVPNYFLFSCSFETEERDCLLDDFVFLSNGMLCVFVWLVSMSFIILISAEHLAGL